ncbi:MAG: alpha/beta hydrolase [Burkholderiaceae bacterium]
MLTIDGRNIDCIESGEGPAVLLIPGSYSTTAAWRQVQRGLAPGRRLVATSLCGYGGTSDSRSAQDFGIEHEVRVVEALARHVDAPVHLVGHSFGGTVALAAALSGRIDVASLALFEANPLALIHSYGDGAVYPETLRMSRGFEAAVAAGEPDAPGHIIDFWGGAGVYAAMPEPVQAYCRQTCSVNVLDWRTDFAFDVGPPNLAALRIPVLLARGSLANSAMVQMTDVMAAHLMDVRPAVVDGAGHFLITTHAAQCAKLLDSFLP